MFKIYYYYKILQSIKNNKIEKLSIYLKKWNGKVFLNKILNYALSYSYKSFELIISYMNNHDIYASYYLRKIELRKDYHFNDIKNAFFIECKNNEEMNRLKKIVRLNIVMQLIKFNHVFELNNLIKELSEEEKKDLFMYFFDGSSDTNFNEIVFDKLIDSFSINKDFFDKEIFEQYSSLGIFISYEKFQYIIKKYVFENYQFENLLLQTDNKDIIRYIINHIDVRYRILIIKVSKHLNHVYKYSSNEEIVKTIHFYKEMNLLDNKIIKQSYNEDGSPIYLDYHYLNLLELSDDTKKLVVKNYLNCIVNNYFNNNNNEEELSISNKLDNYFYYTDNVYPNLHDKKSLALTLSNCIQVSEDASIYFYEKDPHIFEFNTEALFKKFFINYKEIHQKNLLIKKLCEEKNQNLKTLLLTNLIKGLAETYWFSEDLFDVYVAVKNDITIDIKKNLINKLAYKKEAMKIIKSILDDEEVKETLNIGEIFYYSINSELTNSNYFIDNYKIEKIYLNKAYLKLAYYTDDESFDVLARKIVEKDIELNESEQEILKETKYELFKIYNSYELNKKLSQKLEVKQIKDKKTKI